MTVRILSLLVVLSSVACALLSPFSEAPTPLPTPLPLPKSNPPAVTPTLSAPISTPMPARPASTPAESSSAPADLPGRAAPDEGNKHVEVGASIVYQNTPPSSGTHYPQWVRYGVYTQPIPPGFWVHNLEHGAVVVLFKCSNNCAAVAEQVQSVVRTLRPGKYGDIKVVATPYNEMPKNFAVVAWGRADDFDTLDAERVRKFYEAFVDQGPEDVP